MFHAPSLRVIGHSLEVAKLRLFEVETDKFDYVLSSDALTRSSQWILCHALDPDHVFEETRPAAAKWSVRYSPADILRLEYQAKKQRRNSPALRDYRRLSHLLRVLGDYLDQTQVSYFRVSWVPESVSVDYRLLDGQPESRTFTTEKLYQLGARPRVRSAAFRPGISIEPPRRR